MTTRLNHAKYQDIRDDEILVPLTYRQKIICASALQMLKWDATWDYYNDGSDKNKVQDDVENILYRFMCDEQDTEIVQNIIDQINTLTEIVNNILGEVMGDTIINNNINTGCGCGCGCKDNGGTNGGDGGTNGGDDNTTPQTPPPPSTEQTPNNETYNRWLCNASHQASKNLTQFMINAQQASGSIEVVTDFLALQATTMPFLAPYTTSILAFATAIATAVNFYPFSEIISWLSSTEEQRACILYEATTPASAEEAYINYIYESMVNTHGLGVYLLFRPALLLLDYNSVYTENSYSVTENQDCTNCQTRDGQSDPNSVENIVDWQSLGYCLTAPDSITTSVGSGTSVSVNGNVYDWKFENGENLAGMAFSLMQSATDVSGFAFRVKEAEGMTPPFMGGLSSTNIHMTDIMSQSYKSVFVVADSQLTTDLQNSNSPLSIIPNFLNKTFLLFKSTTRSALTITDFHWIHECSTAQNATFYLLVLSDFRVEPSNWLSSGSEGNAFAINDGYYSNGQTNEIIQNISDGFYTNKKHLQFTSWQTDGTRNIRIKLIRVSGNVQGSSESVQINFHGALSSFSYLKIMDNEDIEYTFETTNPPQADTYTISFFDGVSGFMRAIAIYGCEEF